MHRKIQEIGKRSRPGSFFAKLMAMAAIAIGSLLAAQSSAQIMINGAGSTFAYPLYSKWFNSYYKIDPDAQFNYQSIGSGGGIRQVTDGTVDFGATDGPMTPQEMNKFYAERGCHILHFPTALGSVMPTYNLPGMDQNQKLNFTPAALAGIYLGTITKWNDPAITEPNPGIKLPDADIVVIHRSDGSGTTYCWTDYLSKVSAPWKQKVGRSTSVRWPVGLGGKGNEGVSGLVKQTPNSIGYVELIYAIQNHLLYGRVENSSGKFIDATLASTSAAAAGAAKNMPADFRVSITDASGADSYPIATFTWLLIPERIQNPAKGKTIVAFLHWALTDGQKMLAPLDYARVPPEVVSMEEKQIDLIKN
jgi:phosphate transport system substrate-binding protein